MSVPNRSSPLVPVHWPSICRLIYSWDISMYHTWSTTKTKTTKNNNKQTEPILWLGAFGPSNHIQFAYLVSRHSWIRKPHLYVRSATTCGYDFSTLISLYDVLFGSWCVPLVGQAIKWLRNQELDSSSLVCWANKRNGIFDRYISWKLFSVL